MKRTNRPAPSTATRELSKDQLAKIRGGIAVIIIAAAPQIFAFPTD
jgi:hypothetical protein